MSLLFFLKALKTLVWEREDCEREARSISVLCPTRPVLPQGGQSLISGAVKYKSGRRTTGAGPQARLSWASRSSRKIPYSNVEPHSWLVNHRGERNTTICNVFTAYIGLFQHMSTNICHLSSIYSVTKFLQKLPKIVFGYRCTILCNMVGIRPLPIVTMLALCCQ